MEMGAESTGLDARVQKVRGEKATREKWWEGRRKR